MSKNSLAKYYPKKTKKGFNKKLVKCIKIFLKERKTKSKNMVVSDTRISQQMKRKG